MKYVWRCLVVLICLGWGHLALAAPKDYCEAYARDFADAGARDEVTRAKRHKNALAACLFQYQPTREAVAKPVQPKTPNPSSSKLGRVEKPKAIAKSSPEVIEDLPEPAVIVAPDIVPPVKPATSARSTEKVAERKKTLLDKFFPRKAAAPVPPEKLVAGSAAWLDYCARKYASFNRDTGTYTSFKGVERKCLVTE